MIYNVLFSNEKLISKDISKIPKQNMDLIFQKLEKLKIEGVESAQIKKLSNYNLADYRLRVGDFRILFNLDSIQKEIVVFRILHRSKLY